MPKWMKPGWRQLQRVLTSSSVEEVLRQRLLPTGQNTRHKHIRETRAAHTDCEYSQRTHESSRSRSERGNPADKSVVSNHRKPLLVYGSSLPTPSLPFQHTTSS